MFGDVSRIQYNKQLSTKKIQYQDPTQTGKLCVLNIHSLELSNDVGNYAEVTNFKLSFNLFRYVPNGILLPQTQIQILLSKLI